MLDVLDNRQPIPAQWDTLVLPVDKPKGMTSFDVIRRLRKILGVRKIGHAGTLDPMATGLLICLAGRATKRMNEVLSFEKRYTGIIRFGETTPSYDAETPVVATTDISDLTDERIRDSSMVFKGTILQQTPMYSAVRVQGERLYKKARRGERITTPMRYVTIYNFEMGLFDGRDAAFELTCSSGTYVRSIAHELGASLSVGAHLVALRRTRIGEIDVESAWQLDSIPERQNTILEDQARP